MANYQEMKCAAAITILEEDLLQVSSKSFSKVQKSSSNKMKLGQG